MASNTFDINLVVFLKLYYKNTGTIDSHTGIGSSRTACTAENVDLVGDIALSRESVSVAHLPGINQYL